MFDTAMQREDGTNVNQWHWTEKDCMQWSKARLGELFSNLQLVDSTVKAHTTGLESVTGAWSGGGSSTCQGGAK